jgi:hypothetical protein
MVTQAAILKEYGLKYITVVKVGDVIDLAMLQQYACWRAAPMRSSSWVADRALALHQQWHSAPYYSTLSLEFSPQPV